MILHKIKVILLKLMGKNAARLIRKIGPSQFLKLRLAQSFRAKKVLLHMVNFKGYIRPNEPSDLAGFLIQPKEIWFDDFIRNVDRDALHSRRCFIDMGSNIGLTTKRLSDEFKGHSFIMVEMDQENLAFSKYNVEDIPEVNIIHGAVALHSNEAVFYSRNQPSNAYTALDSNHNISATVEVKTISPDDVMATCEAPVLLLKMDIEGSEKYFFQTSTQSNPWLTQTEYFYLEYHHFDENDLRILLDNLKFHSHAVIGQYNFWDTPGWGGILSKHIINN